MSANEINETLEAILDCAISWISEDNDKATEIPPEWKSAITLAKRCVLEVDHGTP